MVVLLLILTARLIVIARPGRIQRSSHDRFADFGRRRNFRQTLTVLHRWGVFSPWEAKPNPWEGPELSRAAASETKTPPIGELARRSGALSKFSLEVLAFPSISSLGIRLGTELDVSCVPISWNSVPFALMRSKLACESLVAVDCWKCWAFPSPAAPSDTNGAAG